MPAERLSMRKIREVLRLTHALGMSRRLSARRRDRQDGGRRVRAPGGGGRVSAGRSRTRSTMPSWSGGCFRRRLRRRRDARRCRTGRTSMTELKRRGVTLAAALAGVSRRARRRLRLQPVLRAATATGGSASRRRCGRRMWPARSCSSTGPATRCRCSIRRPGEERRAHIFVAALGASNYTYAEARWSETLPDWIGAHVNALAAIGGVPKALVPDNLKAGVTKPSRYEPGINRTYQDLADHYGFVVLPTRVTKPRDKAKVEVAVLIVERFVLAQAAQPALLLAGRAERGDPRLRRRRSTPRSCASSARAARELLGDDRPAGAQCAAERALPLCRMEALPASRPTITSRSTATTTRCRRG